jgi:hypothetical protein
VTVGRRSALAVEPPSLRSGARPSRVRARGVAKPDEPLRWEARGFGRGDDSTPSFAFPCACSPPHPHRANKGGRGLPPPVGGRAGRERRSSAFCPAWGSPAPQAREGEAAGGAGAPRPAPSRAGRSPTARARANTSELVEAEDPDAARPEADRPVRLKRTRSRGIRGAANASLRDKSGLQDQQRRSEPGPPPETSTREDRIAADSAYASLGRPSDKGGSTSSNDERPTPTRGS